jgi:hypothetical protein
LEVIMTGFSVRRLMSASLVVGWALVLVSAADAAETGLNRAEVAAVKAKMVAVREAMGSEPEGYALESEDYSLPTDFQTAQAGKFWPINSSVYLNFTDKAVLDAEANADEISAELQARYIAAMTSGNEARMQAALAEMMAAQNGSATQLQDMTVSVQFNMNPYAGIDPDGVLFEGAGYIALMSSEMSEDTGQVDVYIDPVALRETETLSKVELTTPDDGVSNRSGVFNVTVTLNGSVEHIQSWAKSFDIPAMLAVIDKQ